jgi:allantoinase
MPHELESIVRGGLMVNADGAHQADVGIAAGEIVEIAPQISAKAAREIRADGLLVLPGMVDVHLHFNEPGHEVWEGAATGSRALAAGGGTVFFDMPLNSIPCTLNAREVERKRAALERSSVTDFALWGGLTPQSIACMEEMAAAGVVGFKAFMCDSGLPEFSRCDDETLFKGMTEAARLGLPVAVHAESEEITRSLASAIRGRGVFDFLKSRPVEAELDAIGRVLDLARRTGAMLHIVHMSCGTAVRMAVEARQQGVDVSTETCPHYLFFTESDIGRIGVAAKCAPPIRSENEELWSSLFGGDVDIVASDHSPAEPSMKREDDFRGSWGGISGVQSTLAVLMERGYHQRGLSFVRIASLVAYTPATRFRIARKGRIAVGYDADLVLVDPNKSFRLHAGHLQQRHKMTPYLGSTFRGTIRQTIRRGETIYADGRISAGTNGKFIRPIPSRRAVPKPQGEPGV